MYYISDVKVLSSKVDIEILDSTTGDTFKIKEVGRTEHKIIVKPTRPLKKGKLKDIEMELKGLIRGGWCCKDVELKY